MSRFPVSAQALPRAALYNFSTVPFTFSLITSVLSKPSLSTTLTAMLCKPCFEFGGLPAVFIYHNRGLDPPPAPSNGGE
ncbi:MAG: hypothetical protein LBT04_04770 [Prevotellaceae bacterium]|nr:hypothetical protein [Prevotellaceae bacterium]